MKKIFLFFLFAISSVFADQIVLNNETTYPSNDTKMAIQWAFSAKEVDDSNNALKHGEKLANVHSIKKSGKMQFSVPAGAEYFRILMWSKGSSEPDFHTNWVEVINQKEYHLQKDHLVPAVLMSGMGC